LTHRFTYGVVAAGVLVASLFVIGAAVEAKDQPCQTDAQWCKPTPTPSHRPYPSPSHSPRPTPTTEPTPTPPIATPAPTPVATPPPPRVQPTPLFPASGYGPS